jgi:hypothetical protein
MAAAILELQFAPVSMIAKTLTAQFVITELYYKLDRVARHHSTWLDTVAADFCCKSSVIGSSSPTSIRLFHHLSACLLHHLSVFSIICPSSPSSTRLLHHLPVFSIIYPFFPSSIRLFQHLSVFYNIYLSSLVLEMFLFRWLVCALFHDFTQAIHWLAD